MPVRVVHWLFLVLLVSTLTCLLRAQQSGPILVTQAIDVSVRATLKGNVHPLAIPKFDQGAVPPDLPLDRMLLVLKRSPQQEGALLRLLDDQQHKGSPNYHRWLTPQQFGAQFGPSASDVAVVVNWLQTSGFEVGRIGNGRSVIEFSGNPLLVQQAFGTAIHHFNINERKGNCG